MEAVQNNVQNNIETKLDQYIESHSQITERQLDWVAEKLQYVLHNEQVSPDNQAKFKERANPIIKDAYNSIYTKKTPSQELAGSASQELTVLQSIIQTIKEYCENIEMKNLQNSNTLWSFYRQCYNNSVGKTFSEMFDNSKITNGRITMFYTFSLLIKDIFESIIIEEINKNYNVHDQERSTMLEDLEKDLSKYNDIIREKIIKKENYKLVVGAGILLTVTFGFGYLMRSVIKNGCIVNTVVNCVSAVSHKMTGVNYVWEIISNPSNNI
jgi:hypothetical protein